MSNYICDNNTFGATPFPYSIYKGTVSKADIDQKNAEHKYCETVLFVYSRQNIAVHF